MLQIIILLPFFHLFLYYSFWNHTQYVGSGFVVNLAVNGAGEGLIQNSDTDPQIVVIKQYFNPYAETSEPRET